MTKTKKIEKIKQIMVYQPLGGSGGQKLAALGKSGIVYLFDELNNNWIAIPIKLQHEKSED